MRDTDWSVVEPQDDPEPIPTSRAGWLIPLILIAVAVAAVAWRLR